MNKKLILLIGVCLLLVVGCGKTNKEIAPGKITCDQMKEIMKGDNNPRLIDVRTEEEYNEGHLDGAINIPYDVIVNPGVTTYDSIIPDETPIIVYCKSGKRSGTAYDSLVKAGYKKVYDLGAMNNCK
jgi:rhodanese-related sulfurtransferase